MAASRKLLLAISLQTAQAVKEMERMKGQMKALADHTSHMGKTMFNAQVAFAAFQTAIRGVSRFMGDSINAFIEAEKVEAQLNATLKSTGFAAGLTADELKRMAQEMQTLTSYDDEAVLGAENLLLTFTKIGKDIFPQATETVLDMSTALGQDLKSSAIQLGKALQDPILGVTALRRVGVNFNAEQVKTIKNLVETGQSAKAQALILKELQTEFGGSARAARDTLGGALAAIKNQFGDLQETIGAKFAPLLKNVADTLMPALEGPFEDMGEALASILGVVVEVLPTLFELVGVLSPIIKAVMDLASTLFEALRPAFEQVVRIIEILSPIVEKLFQVLAPLVEIFGDVFATALSLVADLLETLSPILNLILDILKPLFEALKPIVHILGEVLKPILELILLPLTMLMDAIKQLGAAIDDSLHHWENLATANAKIIGGLEQARGEYEKMETAIKNGSIKQSELLKTQADLVDKYPELRDQIDLVNGSYEDNIKIIDIAIRKRKEEQVYLLKQKELEIKANIERAKSWLWLNKINQVFNPVAAQAYEVGLKNLEKQVGRTGDEIKTAQAELKEFNDELKKTGSMAKPKAKTGGGGSSGGGKGKTWEDYVKEQIDMAMELARASEDAATAQEDYARAYSESIAPMIESAEAEITEDTAEELEKRRDLYEQWAGTVANSVGDIFSSLGEALATGEDAWAAFAKAGIEAIAGIIDALGNEFLVNAAAAAVEAIFFPPKWAEAAGWAAAGALAKLTAGLVRGWAGSFAEGGSFMTNGPTMMQVGDNPGGVERVTVTPVSSRGSGGGDITITQPVTIVIDGSPIYRGLLRATKSGIALVSAKAVVN